jgi:hypothetical protein
MSSKAFRRVAAILVFVTFAAIAPSHAVAGRRSFDGPAQGGPVRAFVTFLLHLFDFSNGTMDPNG